MNQLTKLTVRGYKSIRSLEDFEMRKLNVLIGANGAGKSNFISLFRMLDSLFEQRLQLHVATQGCPDVLLHRGRKHTENMRIELCLNTCTLCFEFLPTSDNRLLIYSESLETGGIKHTFESLMDESTLILTRPKHRPDWQILHVNDTSNSAKVKRQHGTNDNLRLKPDAANLAAYLFRLHSEHPESHRRIVETIRLAAPFFGDFVHREPTGESIQLEWTEYSDPDTPLKAHMLSDGTLRFICLTTLLLQPTELLPDTVLIDEPELGLHPYAIVLLAEMLREASENVQLIVSTQSVELLNQLDPAEVIVVDRVNDESVFRRLDAEHLQDWLRDYSLGELWKQNVLGGRPAR